MEIRIKFDHKKFKTYGMEKIGLTETQCNHIANKIDHYLYIDPEYYDSNLLTLAKDVLNAS